MWKNILLDQLFNAAPPAPPSLNQLLCEAAETGDEGRVHDLIEKGADPNCANDEGLTPLHIAAYWGWEEVARVLIEKKADVNGEGDEGMFPLHSATLGGNPGMIALLLDAGADIEARDVFRKTPLHYAVIPHERDPDILTDMHGNDGISAIISFPPPADFDGAFDLLLAKGADIDAADDNGQAPIHTAASEGTVVAARTLIKAGADIYRADDTGNTPLHHAARWKTDGNAETLRLLLAENAREQEGEYADAYVNFRNRNGQTAFHTAVEMDAVYNAEILLEWGADFTAPDHGGTTPSKNVRSIAMMRLFVAAKENADFFVQRRMMRSDPPKHPVPFPGPKP